MILHTNKHLVNYHMFSSGIIELLRSSDLGFIRFYLLLYSIWPNLCVLPSHVLTLFCLLLKCTCTCMKGFSQCAHCSYVMKIVPVCRQLICLEVWNFIMKLKASFSHSFCIQIIKYSRVGGMKHQSNNEC